MLYSSTRNAEHKVSSAEAIVAGLSSDGGLFVPEEINKLDIAKLLHASYEEVALAVLQSFLPDYDKEFLRCAITASYGENFQQKAGKIEQLNDDLFSLELWHGPTAAFKDYALQLMPKLLVEARNMLGEKDNTMILVATSGDTGKAALEGYKNLDDISIAVFYPTGGTSEIQRLQMATQDGNNVEVYAVNGNFDDAQRGVKIAFGDKQLAKKLAEKRTKLSSANSINWGRLVPQIVYYVSSYLHLCQLGTVTMGQPVDFCVPTGNFGDIMAGYYAKQMGVPIGRLICASNENNVLTRFFKTGTYNANREFHKTSSPSMDILVSSNLERLLYNISKNSSIVSNWMKQLQQNGCYTVDDSYMEQIRSHFAAEWATEEEVSEEIRNIWEKHHYLCDPHTAVAFHVARKLPQAGVPMVVLSTASPFKFSGKVLEALNIPVPADEFEALAALEKFSSEKAPVSLTNLRGKPVRFTKSINSSEIPSIPLTL